MAKRIDVRTAHEHLQAHPEALLVCAYGDFEAQAEHLPPDREIIFYCA